MGGDDPRGRFVVPDPEQPVRHLGLVTGRRDGNRVIYSLHDDHVGDLVAQAIYHVEHIHLAAQQGRASPPKQTPRAKRIRK